MEKKETSKDMLKDPHIKRWYDNVARGAETTADVYLRRLRGFCRQMNISPLDIVKMEEKSISDLLMDFVASEENRGKTGSYIHSSVKAVKSWLSHNDITIQRKIKIKDAWKATTLVNERIPTIDELRRVFLSATIRDRVSCVLMSHSGFRPETLGSYRGDDGLRIGDFPEMKIKDGKVSFSKVPTIVKVRSELSKAGHSYFSFLGPEGTDYISQYIEERIRSGEEIDSDTDLISPKWASKKFIRTINIGDGVRNAIRAGGYRWRPYILRSFFDSQMLIAESKGKMTLAYREFMMGHAGSNMEARYTTHKGGLTKEMVEDMRESYRKSMVYFQTIETEDDEKNMTEFRKHILRMSGASQDDIDNLDVNEMDDSDVMEYLRKRLLRTLEENGNRQKVISLGHVEEYISKGWEYVNNLPDDRAIMKLP